MKMMIFLFLSAALSAVAAGEPNNPPGESEICKGEVVSLSIQALPSLPESALLSMAGNSKEQFELLAPDKGNFVFIRSCTLDFTHFTLLYVIFSKRNQFGRFELGPDDRVEGLDQAVFGDFSKLNVVLKNPELASGEVYPFNRFIIQGTEVNGISAVVSGHGFDNGESITVMYDSRVIAGELLQGDMPLENGCFPGQTFGKSSFRLASAKFDVTYCSYLTPDRSQAFRFRSLSLIDSSENLPVEYRNKLISLDAEALVNVYTWGHHNVTDDFVLKLPQAEYTAHSGSPFPGMQRSASFSIVYANRSEVSGRAVNIDYSILNSQMDISQ